MEPAVYNRASWRELPRDGDCVIDFIFGAAAGPCHGAMHRHHVDPADPASRSFQVCASHHPRLQAALRRVLLPADVVWKRCPHKPGVHRYAGAREACERQLNRHLLHAA